MSELLRCLIAAYKDAFRSNLSDAVLLANYAQTALVVDELCKEVGGGAGLPQVAGASLAGARRACWCRILPSEESTHWHALLCFWCTCVQGIIDLTDSASIQKAIALRVGG